VPPRWVGLLRRSSCRGHEEAEKRTEVDAGGGLELKILNCVIEANLMEIPFGWRVGMSGTRTMGVWESVERKVADDGRLVIGGRGGRSSRSRGTKAAA